MSELKSIILSSPCIVISLLFLIPTMIAVVAINNESFRKQIINDLPKKTDFEYYLEGLVKAVNFCIRHRVYVDLNMEFGLFMIDVNLKELVQQKRLSFPKNIRDRLEKILEKNNALGHYFHRKVHEHAEEEINDMTQIIYNRTTWSRPSDKFNQDLLKQTKVYSPEMLEQMYGKWEIYVRFTIDVTKSEPSPANMDACTANLASNPVHDPTFESVCQIPNHCQEALEKGSEYGYGLLRRILLMVIARFSRDCVVVSRRADKFKTDTYCMMAFNEAEYNALNSFKMPKLMFEQIALCGLLGHAQFFRNYWVKSLLQYQTEEGCFTHKLATGEFDENQMREGENDTWRLNRLSIMNGQCDGHFTSKAVAALANTLRYIIETYY